jgi:signal transduction histidine kinase
MPSAGIWTADAGPDALRDGRRLQALRRTALLDSPPEAAFDRFTRLAATTLRAPGALLSLVEADRQFFKSLIGLPEPWASRRETPLSHSFCRHVVATGQPLVVADARRHPLVKESPAIRDLGIVAYAGVPLLTGDGYALGSLCVIDTRPRQWGQRTVAVLRDLAASVMTEVELRAARAEAERRGAERDRLLDHARCILWYATVEDRDGRSLRWDLHVVNEDAARRLLPVAQPPGHSGLPYVPCWYESRLPEDKARMKEFAAREVRAGRSYTQEFRCRRADGDIRWLVEDVQIQPLGPGRWRAVGVCMDITERKRAEAERDELLARERAARAEAEAALRARDEFLHIIAHELKTPITSLWGAVQLALRQLDRRGSLEWERVEQMCRTLHGQSSRLVRLIGQILDVPRLHAGLVALDRQPADLGALVRQAVATAQLQTERHTITVDAPDGIMASVDAARLEQVLANLLDNAIRYSPGGGPIEVALRCSDPHTIQLSVRDYGAGVPPEHRPHIFDRFYQGHRLSHASGLGLGLYFAREIVDLHGGRIEAEFPADGGTRVIVSLPAEDAQ